jgi:hypothetical protein
MKTIKTEVLSPCFEHCKSYYGKAVVRSEVCRENGKDVYQESLYSYGTWICTVRWLPANGGGEYGMHKDDYGSQGTAYVADYVVDKWIYSRTTRRHLKEFLAQTAVMELDYSRPCDTWLGWSDVYEQILT